MSTEAPTAADLLSEYGSAVRGSWANLDGRAVRIDLDLLADLMREHGNSPVPDPAKVRADLDLCPKGEGNWTEFCTESCGLDL